MSRAEPINPRTSHLLQVLGTASETHRTALRDELELRHRRDDAIVRAVRAGARLEEIADVGAISRAAASKVARKVLPGRNGRGGPYARRRGAAAALLDVAGATQALQDGRERLRKAKRQRDEAIAQAIRERAPVAEVATAAGMSQASISAIANKASGIHATFHDSAQLHRR
jgi:hypothetical protein